MSLSDYSTSRRTAFISITPDLDGSDFGCSHIAGYRTLSRTAVFLILKWCWVLEIDWVVNLSMQLAPLFQINFPATSEVIFNPIIYRWTQDAYLRNKLVDPDGAIYVNCIEIALNISRKSELKSHDESLRFISFSHRDICSSLSSSCNMQSPKIACYLNFLLLPEASSLAMKLIKSRCIRISLHS